jgi:hypothetical protein
LGGAIVLGTGLGAAKKRGELKHFSIRLPFRPVLPAGTLLLRSPTEGGQILEPSHGQLDDGKPRLSEDDIARALLGPRGVPGKPDTARMTPQQEKNMPKYLDPGHVS